MSKTVEELEQDYRDAYDASNAAAYDAAYDAMHAVHVARKLWQDKLKENTDEQ